MYFKIKTYNPNLIFVTAKASVEALFDWYCINNLSTFQKSILVEAALPLNLLLKVGQTVMCGVETTQESADCDAFMDLTLQAIDSAAYFYCFYNECGHSYFPVSVALSLVGALSSVFNHKQFPNVDEPPRGQQPYAPRLN